VYDRRIKGRELTFGVSGKLHANSLIMYDHQTDSLWSHLVGAAVTGSLKGAKLKPIPSMFTRWDVWLRLHPNTKVMSTGRTRFLASMRDPYESYYVSTDTGIIPTRFSDKRIYPKEYVLGLVLGEKAKAYPFSVLSREVVVNDVFQSMPLVVVFDAATATGAIFKRDVAGKTLSFKAVERDDSKNVVLTDNETNSKWQALAGVATQGKLTGKRLEPFPMTPSFWFGWVDHYPATKLYGIKR